MTMIPSPRSKRRARIEIIPLIDIIFFLLATFVMVSLSMIQNRGIAVQLPAAATRRAAERARTPPRSRSASRAKSTSRSSSSMQAQLDAALRRPRRRASRREDLHQRRYPRRFRQGHRGSRRRPSCRHRQRRHRDPPEDTVRRSIVASWRNRDRAARATCSTGSNWIDPRVRFRPSRARSWWGSSHRRRRAGRGPRGALAEAGAADHARASERRPAKSTPTKKPVARSSPRRSGRRARRRRRVRRADAVGRAFRWRRRRAAVGCEGPQRERAASSSLPRYRNTPPPSLSAVGAPRAPGGRGSVERRASA